jgi:GxxExxY protein
MVLIREEETYKIIGTCMEVYNELGYGFSEVIYKDALVIEAELCGVRVDREKPYNVYYKTRTLKRRYNADFVMFGDIIVEIKASGNGLCDDNFRQTINYMRASGNTLALLVNFGKKGIQHKRFVL